MVFDYAIYWLLSAIGFLVLLVSSGVRAFPSTLVLPWQQSFGWSRGEISAVIATGTLLFGLVGPFSAAFLQRYGARKVGTVVLIVLTIVTLIMPLMKDVWQAEILIGLISGTMTGAVADVYGIYLANNWFNRGRGLVLGIFTASSSVGQLLVLPVMTSLIKARGWQFTTVMIALFILLVLCITAGLVRDYPYQVGLTPLGLNQKLKPNYPDVSLDRVLRIPLKELKVAAHYRVFWLLAVPFLVCGASSSGLIGVHFIAAGHDYGITAVKASEIMALMGVFDITGSLVAGYLTEIVDSRLILLVVYALRGLDLFLLPVAFHQGGALLIGYAIIFGLSWNATVSPTIHLISQFFGIEKSGVLFGWIFVMHQVGGAEMAYMSGMMHDLTQTYVMAFVMAGVMCVVAALMVIIVPRVKRVGE